MRSGANSELTWQALRYVCGELPAGEQAAFEQRLDQDQDAREAVAEAVALVDAVAQLPPGRPPVLSAPGRSTRVPLLRWGLAAAASLLLALGLRVIWVSPARVESRPPIPAGSALAVAWSGVHAEDDDTDSLIQWLDASSQTPETYQMAALESSESLNGDVPDWMLEAASLGLDGRKEN